MALQKAISKKKKSFYFKKKLKRMLIILKNYGKLLRNEIRQSKSAKNCFEKDGAIQFEPTKN